MTKTGVKITNVEQPDPVITVDLGNGQTIKGTVKELRAASKTIKDCQDICAAAGISEERAKELIALAIKHQNAGYGHNSGETQDAGGVAGKRLLSFIERVERLEGEIGGLKDDVKDVYAEAKGVGFDTKTIRRLIKERKMSVEKRREEDELLELYKSAIGMA